MPSENRLIRQLYSQKCWNQVMETLSIIAPFSSDQTVKNKEHAMRHFNLREIKPNRRVSSFSNLCGRLS
jgi:hypothetical protein